MREEIYYRLAGITIRVGLDFSYRSEYSYMRDFILDYPEKPDYCLEFEKIQDITAFTKKAPHFVGEFYHYHFYQDDEEREYCFHLKDAYYHAVTILEKSGGKCYYISEGWLFEKIRNGYQLENFFWLEKIFQMFSCMVLHSCHIQMDGRAILFTAPSGTGKSTQGNLWVQQRGAEVINGDRTAIRKVNGQWMAYGLPFCGTSGIHRNHEEPIRAIVVLRQYPENRPCVLSGRMAFSAVYSELTVNAWNRGFVESATEWTMELISEVPVYGFLCTKETEAVDVLEQFIAQTEEGTKI